MTARAIVRASLGSARSVSGRDSRHRDEVDREVEKKAAGSLASRVRGSHGIREERPRGQDRQPDKTD